MTANWCHRIRLNNEDNVAVAVDELNNNHSVTITLKGQKQLEEITTRDKKPCGHKISLVDIKKGEQVIKYGEIIGNATTDILKGEHVHVHNLESLRERDDLKE